MSTIGVRSRKSAGVLSGPRFDGGPSNTLYPHSTIVTTPSVTCQPNRPSRRVRRTYRSMDAVNMSALL